MEKIYVYFLGFIIYSFLGWIMETALCSFLEKKIVNRGFLIGPICPIYGSGAILISMFLSNYKNDWVVVFCLATILAGILEYFTSWAMEKIFHARWWDYSENKFNINGRICLETMIPFGILGLLLIYILNPVFLDILRKIPSNVVMVVSIILLILLIVDITLSFNVVSKVTKTVKNINNNENRKDNTKEITDKVKELLRNTWRGNRLVEAFPRFETITKKVRKVANDTVKKGKEAVEKGKQVIEKGKKIANEKIKKE